MRRLLLIAPFLLFAACGDDEATLGERLGDDPTREECIDAMQEMLQALEVPEGVDVSDGLDEEERGLAEAAVDEVAEDVGIDPDAEDDPCEEPMSGMTEAEYEEAVEGIDPDVIAMLGANAEETFEETGTAIEN